VRPSLQRRGKKRPIFLDFGDEEILFFLKYHCAEKAKHFPTNLHQKSERFFLQKFISITLLKLTQIPKKIPFLSV